MRLGYEGGLQDHSRPEIVLRAARQALPDGVLVKRQLQNELKSDQGARLPHWVYDRPKLVELPRRHRLSEMDCSHGFCVGVSGSAAVISPA